MKCCLYIYIYIYTRSHTHFFSFKHVWLIMSFVNSPPAYSSSYSSYICIWLILVLINSSFDPSKMAPFWAEITREKFDAFENSFHLKIKRRHKLIRDRIGRFEISVLFNQTHTNTHTHTHAHTHTHTHTHTRAKLFERIELSGSR